ncbi:MAG: aminotransferase class III-fold pyridoxal phosphate-dependent enzyme [Trueperaceae bacterium]
MSLEANTIDAQTVVSRAEPSVEQLPLSTRDVLEGLAPGRVLQLEIEHGNGDMMRTLDALGLAGPYKATSPWELEDERGRKLVHAGGYSALPFGEGYEPLVEFARDYFDRRRTMGFAQQSASEWRAALEANLVALLAARAPSHSDSQVFFSNSGAEAIEAALKFVRAARPKATVILNFSRAYHGKTFGALSLTPNDDYQGPFKPFPGDVRTLPYGDADAFEQAVHSIGHKNVVAIFVEPIQGEAGVIHPEEGFLPALGEIARRYGIPVVADEIQSGLGRTGHWFASIAGGLEPDIITLAKPLSGGIVPIGATIARKGLVKRLLGGLNSRRHSSTFGGGSFAAAMALRSLELIIEEGLIEKSRADGERGLARLREIQARYPGYLSEVRGAGMLFALQLRNVVKPSLLPGHRELITIAGGALALRAFHLGGIHACFTLNASGVVRLTPALNMPARVFDEMFDRVERIAAANPQAWRMVTKLPPGNVARLLKLISEGA